MQQICVEASPLLFVVVSICLTQGNPVQEATLVLKMGGRQVTEQLMDQVCGKATS